MEEKKISQYSLIHIHNISESQLTRLRRNEIVKTEILGRDSTNGLSLLAKLIFRILRRCERSICKANLQVSTDTDMRNNQPLRGAIA